MPRLCEILGTHTHTEMSRSSGWISEGHMVPEGVTGSITSEVCQVPVSGMNVLHFHTCSDASLSLLQFILPT